MSDEQRRRDVDRKRYHSSYQRALRKSHIELRGKHAEEFAAIFKRRLRQERDYEANRPGVAGPEPV